MATLYKKPWYITCRRCNTRIDHDNVGECHICDEGKVMAMDNPYGGSSLGCSDNNCGRLFSYSWFECPQCKASLYNVDILIVNARKRHYFASLLHVSLSVFIMLGILHTILCLVQFH